MSDALFNFLFMMSVPTAMLLFCLAMLYRPVDRLWNLLFQKYYLDPKTDEVYRLLVYWGYDKHSAVVADVLNITSGYRTGAGDWFYRLERLKGPVPDKRASVRPKFAVIPGGKKKPK